jgi:hypothetical protein
VYGMKQPIVPKGAVLLMVWAVPPSTPAFFLSHFIRTQESLAKSTFASQSCQRSNGSKSLRIKDNLAAGFGLQRLGEVDRKTVSRLDSCCTAIVAENLFKSVVREPDAPAREARSPSLARRAQQLRTSKNAMFFQVFQQ